EPGSAQIKKENEGTLLEISNMIHVMDNYIRIEGHTDNIPMNSDLFPSNWDLSSARAVNVVRLFVNNANASPEKLIAVGYGEYRPIADNATEEGRAKNRRIDIIVLSEKYNDLEQ
ncbi:MAG TPA: OmpA family protein, partial [Anaerovoracaceae bacterium]|nr:OmpA family protein [Anaerovoracaceae bacterium]